MTEGKVLLVLGISAENYGGISLGKTAGGRDVKVNRRAEESEEVAAKEALRYAGERCKKLVVLSVIYSDLYHYGYNDIILPAPSKSQFLSYVRDTLIERARRTAARLRKKAKDQGVPVEVKEIESEDPPSSVLEEASKGYDMIFLPREGRHLFPLFKKTAEQVIKKEGYRYRVTG